MRALAARGAGGRAGRDRGVVARTSIDVSLIASEMKRTHTKTKPTPRQPKICDIMRLRAAASTRASFSLFDAIPRVQFGGSFFGSTDRKDRVIGTTKANDVAMRNQ